MIKKAVIAGIAAGLMGIGGGAMGAPVLTVTVGSHPASVVPGGHGTLAVTLAIAPGYHIYANKLSDPSMIPTVVSAKVVPGVTFGTPHYPASHTLSLPGLGSYPVYTGKVVVSLPFTVAKSAKAGAVSLNASVHYQGCNANSCFPPTTVSEAVPVQVK